MTFSLGLITLISRSLSVRWQFAFMDIYGDNHKLPILRILRRIIIFTALIETTIAVLLFPFFLQHYPVVQALWYAIFHSVSSFCNAGFSTFSDSLISYSDSYYLNIVISFSIISGGLGFLVIHDIMQNIKKNSGLVLKKMTLHSKVVLLTSLVLIVIGTVFFFFSENSNSLFNKPLHTKLIISFFQSVTCRTAGFNTIDIAALKETTLFFMMLLMFVGGSPGSIAGGIKTTTLWVICAIIIGQIRRHEQIRFFNRAISRATAERSTTLFILALLLITLSTLIVSGLNFSKNSIPFLHTLFEMTSAFGTVGLSTGITPQLSTGSKITTALVMLLGRLGPLTFLAAFREGYRVNKLRYPEEHIMIG